jgi:lactaldehyde dehydrogenase/glycolaldehyde dehydrogenase
MTKSRYLFTYACSAVGVSLAKAPGGPTAEALFRILTVGVYDGVRCAECVDDQLKGDISMPATQACVTCYEMLIDGEFVSSTKTLQVVNPTTEQVISEVPDGTVEDVNRAVLAAEKAQKSWAALPAIRRAAHLREITALIRANREFLARILAAEQGKILSLSQIEVDFAADYLDHMAEFARRYEGEITPSDRPGENILVYKMPIGVIAGILPWNFPMFLIVRKVGPALITGNTIVIKPSKETPNIAFEFAKLVAQTSLPKGVFNLVSGTGPVVGHALASHPKVGMVSMTGSVEGGIAVMRAAADNVTKVSLELGGKAPAIVMADADIDLAVRSIKASRIINTGQACNCAERVYVHESIAEEFIAKMTAAMEQTVVGDPFDSATEMGPLVSKQQLDQVSAAVTLALKQGAELKCGGARCKVPAGYFFQPTVLTNCRQDSAIMQKEVFGPVLPITTFKTLDEAIACANDCEYGLTSSIYTRSLDAAMRATNELKFGETYVNRENFEAMQGFHAGCRKSGIGGADGKHGLEEYLQTHVIYMNYNLNKQ